MECASRLRASPARAAPEKKGDESVAAPVSRCFNSALARYGSEGVFSAKYSWLSALSTAFLGLRVARLLQAVWP